MVTGWVSGGTGMPMPGVGLIPTTAMVCAYPAGGFGCFALTGAWSGVSAVRWSAGYPARLGVAAVPRGGTHGPGAVTGAW